MAEVSTNQKRGRGRPKGSKDNPTVKRPSTKPNSGQFKPGNTANPNGRPRGEFRKAKDEFERLMKENPDFMSPLEFFMHGYNGSKEDANAAEIDFSMFEDKDRVKCAEGMAKYLYSQHNVTEEVKTTDPEELDRQLAALLKDKLT